MQWDHVKVPPLSSVQLGRGESCLKWKHHKRLMAETASFMGSMQGRGITSRQVMKSGLWHLNKTLLSIREIAESGMLEIRPGSNRTCSKKQNQKTSHQGSSSCWTRCKEPLILNILLVRWYIWHGGIIQLIVLATSSLLIYQLLCIRLCGRQVCKGARALTAETFNSYVEQWYLNCH